MRRFQLHRHHDPTGVSGTGIVAEGVEFADGSAVVRWLGDWPTSVVFHDRGIDSIDHLHGHTGATSIVWLDDPLTCPVCAERVSSQDELDAHSITHARNIETGGRL